MPVWWTNRSRPSSSGVMKPKPLSSLNHFTVPVAILICSCVTECCERGDAGETTAGAEHWRFAGWYRPFKRGSLASQPLRGRLLDDRVELHAGGGVAQRELAVAFGHAADPLGLGEIGVG